jgi:hypothetical protein
MPQFPQWESSTNLMTKTHRPTQLQKATEFCNTIPLKTDKWAELSPSPLCADFVAKVTAEKL